MATTGAYLPIEPFSGGIYERGTLSLPEKASGTWKRGAVLIYNGGYVEEAGTGPSTVRYIAVDDGQNGSTDGAKVATVWPITATDLWTFSLKQALAVTDNGGVYGLIKDATTGAWYLDTGDAGDQVEVLARDQTPLLGAIGDDKARVIGHFQVANIAGLG